MSNLLLALLLAVSFDKGWNFRASSGFVVDGTNETYSLGEAYPTTRNGVTFGFGTDLSANARDRDSAVDRRLAGMDFQSNNGTQDVFRVDVPAAGQYTIRIAMGDAGSAGLNQPYLQIRDGASVLATIDHSGSATVGTDMVDATGTTYSLANWPASNTAITVTLTGTILNFALGTPAAGTNLSMLAHIFISQVQSTQNFYLSNPVQGGANAGFLTATAPTASTSTTGWTVGTTAINQYSRQTYNSEVGTTGFTSTAQPSGSPVNLGEDCFRSAATTGTFSAGTWYSSVSVLAVSSGGIQQGRARFRLWRSSNADGTGATEITQGTMIGSQVTELSTTVAQTSSASTQVSALTLSNEFLFHQIAWETL